MKVGLEIHRQLDTEQKLFCACPTNLSSKTPTFTFTRRLRPTQSELGQVDPAALFEFRKGKYITYEADPESTCLVELDEEPPHPLNTEALDVALTASLLFNSTPLDEIHGMRKIVIDGSNTTGFQRTMVIALDGKLSVDGKEIPIQQVTLEEDSARKTGETKDSTLYRLDRLGVPLIEISTGPVINSPEEAGRAASAIGRVLRATGKVKRGLGSIRQDLNISIKHGALIEIKGVQELELVSKVVEFEVQRQQSLLAIREELQQRHVEDSDFKEEFVDVSGLLETTESKIVHKALKQGGIASAVRLKGFGGLLKRELAPGIRLGTELAKRAAFWGRVGGIFHSDELPAYGIDASHATMVAQSLGCQDTDAFVIIAGEKENVLDGLKAVIDRAQEAIHMVPEETRAANPDGTTHYMRPRPGAARMYPETDVPPVPISKDRLDRIAGGLPRMPEEVAGELEAKYGLSHELASQLVGSDYLEVFEKIVGSSSGVAPSYVATVLTESLKSLRREEVPVDNLLEYHLYQTFTLVGEGVTAKESVVDILKWLANHADSSANKAVEQLRLEMLSRADLEAIVHKVIDSNKMLLQNDRSKAFGKMMNLVMGEVRGKADPRTVGEILRAKLERVSS